MQSADTAKRERWAWYWYDFGNSAYAAVVLLAVFSAYFQGTVVGGAEGSRLWGYSVGIAMLVVAVTSPILGAIADFSGSKKKFLLGFTFASCLFTGLLFFVQAGDVVMGMVFFILAEIGYRSAQVFYNALLPEIASPDEMAGVSGRGWAIGSAGGVICLFIILPLIMFIGGQIIVRLSLVITALFFMASTIPLIVNLKEKAQPQPLPEGKNILQVAFGRLGRTLKKIGHFRELVKFIIAFLIYNDGVIMALDFAAIIGAVLFGMDQQSLIIFVIIVQVTNVAGAWAFGELAERISVKRSLIISLLMMIAIVTWMALAQSITEFYFIGAAAGFAMAGIQSISRTMIGYISPQGQSAEFYGFFAVAGRTSSFIGPAVYGWIAAEVAIRNELLGLSVEQAEMVGQRAGVVAIGVFLAIGTVLLLIVNQRRAREAAENYVPVD